MIPAVATFSRLTSPGLYSVRLTLSAPDDHVVLPEIISKEPLGPAVRQGDRLSGPISSAGLTTLC